MPDEGRVSTDYDRLESEQAKPKRPTDYSAKLEPLPTLAATNGPVEARILTFCESKRISRAALVALDTRIKIDSNGGVLLAWGYPAHVDGRDIVSAIKYRSLDPEKRRYAENGSMYLQPLIV